MPCGRALTWVCVFAKTGFVVKSTRYPPCHVRYHVGCIRAGAPFESRHRDASQGLEFNSQFAGFPFVCEYCTVRANVRRPLYPTDPDVQLLMLERMRMIDCSNAWSQGTSRSVASNLRQLYRFATKYNIPWDYLHFQEHLQAPPHGPSLMMLWTMEWYTLQVSTKGSYDRIRYNTARHLRSALHNLLSWEGTLLPEGLSFRDKDRLHLPPLVSASGSLIVQLTTSGMERRLGTDSTPSVALQATHVRKNIQLRQEAIATLGAHPAKQYQLYLAQLADTLAWLGWLRALELFSLRWKDVELVRPSANPKYGLPPGSGALLLRLLESTKSNQTKTADHIVAYRTASGFTPGLFYDTLLQLRPPGTPPEAHIFVTETGRIWNSYHFRDTFLYPGLTQQWMDQDPLLQTYAPRSPDDISKKFYSMGSYRRGGRTHVSKKRPGCIRKATQLEVLDHGRWRTRYRTHPDMPTHYQETTFEDRLYITLLCM